MIFIRLFFSTVYIIYIYRDLRNVLHTERLKLRFFQVSDAGMMYQLNNDLKALKYTGDVPFQNKSSAVYFLANYLKTQPLGFGRMAVIHRESNSFLGWCGLNKNEEGLVDIGFRFFPKYWNNGYATEAGRVVLEYGFNTLSLAEVIGRTDHKNTASIKVLEKLEMNFWKKGEYTGIKNCLFYRLSKAQYLRKS